jgi:glycosyltransferase involved in cell wall biosynthesis
MKLKVLLLHNIMWSHYKAAVFSELFSILDKNKFEFKVVQFALTEKQREGLGSIDFSHHRYPYELLFNSSMDEVPIARQIWAIVRVMYNFPCDIIVIPGYAYSMCWIAWLFSVLSRRKIMVSFDSTEMDNPHPWYKEALKRLFIAGCSGAFCYGNKSREYLLKLGMKDKDIHVRCQATDNERIRSNWLTANDKKVELTTTYHFSRHNLIYVGRLSREKNIDSLLSAYARVKKGNPRADDWGLIIVGEGPERQALTKMVADGNMANVYFTGGKSWEEVPAFYALSNVFVLPSLSEPWGLVVNEAMVCGLPVIVSNRCGAAYDILEHGENGFMFDPLDVNDLAGRLSYFVDNHDEIERMGSNSQRLIADFTPLHAAQQMKRGLEETILLHPMVSRSRNLSA